jgi:hypothetical protein
MSIRNNDERAGARQSDEVPAAAVVPPSIPASSSNVGLNFVVPTEFVEIPSRGKYYPENHALHNQTTIEVRHMTAREEDILTSRTLLKKGIAIDRMLQNIIVDKRIKPESLIIGDKNAVIVAARCSAYGSDYTTKVTCPSCTTIGEHMFDLGHIKYTHPDDNDTEEFTATDNGTFLLTLPLTDVSVEVRLLTGKDEIWLAKMTESKKKHKLGETTLTDQMRLFIVGINGVTNKSQINSFIDAMPARDSRYLRNTYTKIVPNVDLTQDFECDSCGGETQMEVPFTADFFWPKS